MYVKYKVCRKKRDVCQINYIKLNNYKFECELTGKNYITFIEYMIILLENRYVSNILLYFMLRNKRNGKRIL